MNKTNCQNCGAPIDETLRKCPYCGTSYCNSGIIRLKLDHAVMDAVLKKGLSMVFTLNEIRSGFGLPPVKPPLLPEPEFTYGAESPFKRTAVVTYLPPSEE